MNGQFNIRSRYRFNASNSLNRIRVATVIVICIAMLATHHLRAKESNSIADSHRWTWEWSRKSPNEIYEPHGRDKVEVLRTTLSLTQLPKHIDFPWELFHDAFEKSWGNRSFVVFNTGMMWGMYGGSRLCRRDGNALVGCADLKHDMEPPNRWKVAPSGGVLLFQKLNGFSLVDMESLHRINVVSPAGTGPDDCLASFSQSERRLAVVTQTGGLWLYTDFRKHPEAQYKLELPVGTGGSRPSGRAQANEMSLFYKATNESEYEVVPGLPGEVVVQHAEFVDEETLLVLRSDDELDAIDAKSGQVRWILRGIDVGTPFHIFLSINRTFGAILGDFGFRLFETGSGNVLGDSVLLTEISRSSGHLVGPAIDFEDDYGLGCNSNQLNIELITEEKLIIQSRHYEWRGRL